MVNNLFDATRHFLQGDSQNSYNSLLQFCCIYSLTGGRCQAFGLLNQKLCRNRVRAKMRGGARTGLVIRFEHRRIFTRLAALLRVHFTVRIISFDTEIVTRLIKNGPRSL